MNVSMNPTRPTPLWLRALAYILCMTAAVVSCSAIVIGGILAGASGMSALVLAAAVPLVGLAWAVVLSYLHDSNRRPPQGPSQPQPVTHLPQREPPTPPAPPANRAAAA